MKPPIYNTGRFILKPYDLGDEERFVETGTDNEVVKFMGDSSLTAEEHKRYERELFKGIFKVYEQDEERFFWIWGVYENNKLVAHFELKETENTSENELEVVYMVHPDERRKGIMTDVLEFVIKKQKLQNKKIIATVDFENVNSISLLEKCGVEKKEIVKDSDGEFYKFYLE